jgi:hypothetical protein
MSELSEKVQEQEVDIAKINTKLDSILLQVTKTNGRVSMLEKWMWTVSGAVAVLAFLLSGKLLNL